jgi:hypothetical protein
MNQRDDAAKQEQPPEGQHRGESGCNVACNTDEAEKHEQDSKGQEPRPGSANLFHASNEWIP